MVQQNHEFTLLHNLYKSFVIHELFVTKEGTVEDKRWGGLPVPGLD